MTKENLIKWLETLPENAEISIRDIGMKRPYPLDILKLEKLYVNRYDYYFNLKNYMLDYEDASKEELKESKKYFKENYKLSNLQPPKMVVKPQNIISTNFGLGAIKPN
jgi:hypothetical protein